MRIEQIHRPVIPDGVAPSVDLRKLGDATAKQMAVRFALGAGVSIVAGIISKAVGAASSGTVGFAWYPDRLNTPGQVLARTGSAYGGYLASAIFQEFQGEIFHYLGKMLGTDRGSPSGENK